MLVRRRSAPFRSRRSEQQKAAASAKLSRGVAKYRLVIIGVKCRIGISVVRRSHLCQLAVAVAAKNEKSWRAQYFAPHSYRRSEAPEANEAVHYISM